MITNSVFSETRAKVDAHLISVMNKKGRGLPNHELLYTLIHDCQLEPSADKIRYLNKLYWVLTDLLSTVYQTFLTVKTVDVSTCSIIYSQQRRCVNRMGPYEQLEDLVTPDNEDHFQATYVGKTFAELEQLIPPAVHENSKLDIYSQGPETEEDVPETIWQVFNIWNNPKGTKGAIEEMFKPVLNANYGRIEFETFVKELTPPDQAPEPTEPILDRTPFRIVLTSQLLREEGLFPSKKLALAEKKGLEFLGYLTGYTYLGHLKKANTAVNNMLKNITGEEDNFTPPQWQERIKDIRAVKEALTSMNVPNAYAKIQEYEVYALKKLGFD